MCMCVCSLSLFLFLSLFSLRSGGSNICFFFFFFYTWPCLFGSSYQRRLVGALSLCLPSFLSGPVWLKCLQTALRLFIVFIFPSSSLFLSFLFLSHDRHGWAVPLPSFPSVYLPHFLSLCITLMLPTVLFNLSMCISFRGTDRRVGKVEQWFAFNGFAHFYNTLT